MRFAACAIIAVGCFVCCTGLFAQSQPGDEQQPTAVDSNTAAQAAATDALTTRIERVRPDVFVLRDEKGQLHPMLGWTYEQFMQLWQQQQLVSDIAADEPTYLVESIKCKAQLVGEDIVELVAEIAIRTQRDGRVAVPLAFPKAVLTDFDIQGADESAYVYFDAAQDQHRLWLNGGMGRRVSLTMHLRLRIRGGDGQKRLSFFPPRASVSQLELAVDHQVVKAEVNSPTTQVSSREEEGRSIIDVSGFHGPTEITWQMANQPAPPTDVLVVDNRSVVTAARDSLSMDVALLVESAQDPLDAIRIQLPLGFELQMAPSMAPIGANGVAGIDVSPIKADEPTAPSVYLVQFHESQSSSQRIEFKLSRPLALADQETHLELSGVEVLGAVGQKGYVALDVSKPLRIRWGSGTFLRQVAAFPETSRDKDYTAIFQTMSSNWKLPLFISSTPIDILVTPNLKLQVGREDLTIDAQFEYQVRGTQQFAAQFDLGAWELVPESVGPASIVAGDDVSVHAGNVLFVRFGEPVDGTFTVRMQLRMPRDRESQLVQIRLPHSLDGRNQVGQLRVWTNPLERLISRLGESQGLEPPFVTPSDASPSEPARTYEQMLRIMRRPAEYHTEVRLREQGVKSLATVTATVDTRSVGIEEMIDLEVSNQPADSIELRVPEPLADENAIEFWIDEIKSVPNWQADPAGDEAYRIAHFPLEQSRLGNIQVRVRYAWQFEALPDDGPRVATINTPLIMPVADLHDLRIRLINGQAPVQAHLQLPIASSRSTGRESSHANGNGNTKAPWTLLSTPLYELPIQFLPQSPERSNAFVFERMWVQTWVVGNRQRSRIRAQLRVPAAAFAATFRVDGATEVEHMLVNGKSVTFYRQQDGAHIWHVDVALRDQTCQIEIIQRRSASVGVLGQIRAVPPQLENAVMTGKVIWQVMLPSRLLALDFADELVSESPWTFQGAHFERVAALSSSQLGTWMGVEIQDGVDDAGGALLASGFALPSTLAVRVVGRSMLMLLTSGCVLALGLLLWRFPRLARWEIFAVLVVVLGTAALMFPTYVPLVAQAAAMGVPLIAVLLMLNRIAIYWQQSRHAGSVVDATVHASDSAATSRRLPVQSSSAAESSTHSLLPKTVDSGA